MPTDENVDQNWLQPLLERAVSERWCTRINCTTCGAHQFRDAYILEARKRANPSALPPFDMAAARILTLSLRNCLPPNSGTHEFEESTRLVLYELWATFGDTVTKSELFPLLQDTWAGSVLHRMQAHYQRRLDARAAHEERQGQKQPRRSSGRAGE